MEEPIDFEELIDVKPFLSSVVDTTESQISSQDPLGDVLDKMCKAMSENNLDIDNVLEDSKADNVGKVDEPIIDFLDDFENFLAATSISKDSVEDTEKIDNIVIDLTTEEDFSVNAVMPYEIPIYFGEIGPAINETAATDKEEISNTSGDANELDKEISLLDLAVNYRNNAETKGCEHFNYSGTIETANEEYNEPVINLDDWKDILPPTFTDTDSDDGYNSSDFEFICENEARKAGIVTKNNNEQIYKPVLENFGKTYSHNPITSRRNEASYSDYIKYSKYRYVRCYAHVSSERHIIPEGERYLDLFRGEYSPMIINNLHVLKNKSIPLATAMTTRSDDLNLGFQVPVLEENEEYKEEADECAKLIISNYPGENRKKRRRY